MTGNDGGYYRRSSYDYTGGERYDLTKICGLCCACFKCFGCCKDLGGCLEQCTEGIGLFCSSCIARFKVSTCCGCICDKKDDYSRRNQRKYDCRDCSCGKSKCQCYWLCGGEAAVYVCLCIIIASILLLPLMLFAIIATPFWLLGQLIASKLNSQRKFYIVVIIFIIILIPPFIIWFLLFAQVCDGYDSGKGGSTQIMCFIWSVVNTIYE